MPQLRTIRTVLVATFVGAVVLCGCQTKLDRTLELAGENRSELEKVLEHFADSAQKYEAARFLIENMEGKASALYLAYDRNGRECRLDNVDITLLDQLTFSAKPIQIDLESISAEFLIENINLAFEARRRYPWCAALDFNEFCCSVLPYRIKFEPLESWRSYYLEQYGALADSLAGAGCSLSEVVFFLNEKLGKQYIQVADRIIGDLSFREIEHIGGGTCDDLALNAVQLMRALGIPLQLDLLPYHGRVNGGHAYNSFRDEDSVFYFFSPYERSPERNLWVAPLVFRLCYEIQPEREFEKTRWNGLLCSRVVKNVTREYYPVSRVDIAVDAPHGAWVALGTYNRAKLHVVAQSKVNSQGRACFDHVARELLYFVVRDSASGLIAAGSPFVLSDDGNPDFIDSNDTSLAANGIWLYDVKKITPLTDRDITYELRAWNKGWRTVAHSAASDSGTLDFGRIDQQSVFLVWGYTPLGRTQRPFIIKDGEKYFY